MNEHDTGPDPAGTEPDAADRDLQPPPSVLDPAGTEQDAAGRDLQPPPSVLDPAGTEQDAAGRDLQPPPSVLDPAGTDDPLSEAEIQELRKEIDRLDAEILAAVTRRSEISRRIGATRMRSGGTKLVHTRELKVYERFASLGAEGPVLAAMLLRLGRGRLG